VNRPASVSLIDLLMIFRFNTKYAPRLSPSPRSDSQLAGSATADYPRDGEAILQTAALR